MTFHTKEKPSRQLLTCGVAHKSIRRFRSLGPRPLGAGFSLFSVFAICRSFGHLATPTGYDTIYAQKPHDASVVGDLVAINTTCVCTRPGGPRETADSPTRDFNGQRLKGKAFEFRAGGSTAMSNVRTNGRRWYCAQPSSRNMYARSQHTPTACARAHTRGPPRHLQKGYRSAATPCRQLPRMQPSQIAVGARQTSAPRAEPDHVFGRCLANEEC